MHFAEQRSAPYSMLSRGHAVETQVNNVVGTLNLLFALRDHAPDCHLVKLGTMGEYGTPNIDIEEGYLDITHNGRTDRLPFPKQPGSMYHLSKVHDSHNIAFTCRIWGLRATDLNQGVVYGANTTETALHRDLATRFDYDGIWGTVLNRFCVQAAIGQPLSVHGKGGQLVASSTSVTPSRASTRLPQPAAGRRVPCLQPVHRAFSILDLANRVRDARAAHGLPTEIVHQPNPRVELEGHYYNAKHQHLLDLGLHPHALADTLIEDVIHTVERHAGRVRPHTLVPPWTGAREATCTVTRVRPRVGRARNRGCSGRARGRPRALSTLSVCAAATGASSSGRRTAP